MAEHFLYSSRCWKKVAAGSHEDTITEGGDNITLCHSRHLFRRYLQYIMIFLTYYQWSIIFVHVGKLLSRLHFSRKDNYTEMRALPGM